MRIALITDPMEMDFPEFMKETYQDYLQQGTNSIADAIIGLEHQFRHFEASHELIDEISEFRPDLVFNRSNHEGQKKGYAEIPDLLDQLGIPFTGPNARDCLIAFDKHLTKIALTNLNIPIAKFILVEHAEDIDIPGDMSYPLFIKPVMGGCSLGIEVENLVYQEEACVSICRNLINRLNRPVLVEEFLNGREFTVGVLGNEEPYVLPILEFVYSPGGDKHFRSFTAKMILYQDEETACPAEIPMPLESEIIDLALRTYRGMGCHEYARVDIRLDQEGHPKVLEVNAYPGLDPHGSSFVQMASVAGFSYQDLIGEIIGIACRTYHLDT